jgi:hypothetical protein
MPLAQVPLAQALAVQALGPPQLLASPGHW